MSNMLTTAVPASNSSPIQHEMTDIERWCAANNQQLNIKKSFELIVCPRSHFIEPLLRLKLSGFPLSVYLVCASLTTFPRSLTQSVFYTSYLRPEGPKGVWIVTRGADTSLCNYYGFISNLRSTLVAWVHYY